MAYKVSGLWWNGHDFDAISKECLTKEATLGAVSLLLREIRPFQILISDLDNKEPIPNDLFGVASSLNKPDGQLTLFDRSSRKNPDVTKTRPEARIDV